MKRKPDTDPKVTRTFVWTLLLKSRSRRLAALLILAIVTAAITISTISLAQTQGKLVDRESSQTPPRRASIVTPKRSSQERPSSGKNAKRRSPRHAQQEQDGTLGSPQEVARERHRAEGRPREWRLRRARPFIGDLRQLSQIRPLRAERPEREGPEPSPGMFVPPGGTSAPAGEEPEEPAAPNEETGSPAPPPTSNFEGLDFNNFGNGHPPDTVGDVGPNHYIQAINSSIGIYDKATGNRVAAFSFNTFMSQGNFGNLCDTNNFGDPVVLYDTFEDRWIITDFAFKLDSGGNVINPPGAFQCFAVSRSGDPVSGGWNFYSINTAGGLGDYPKFGIWPDGLYMSANMFGYTANAAFQGPRVYALNKAQMYAGAPTVQSVSFDAPVADFTLLPSNARLQTGTPPPGTPNYFLSTWQFLNGVSVYKFHVDWDKLSLSTFTGPDVPVAATSWPNANVANAPSLGGNSLDVLQIRAMMQNQYTKIGGVESLWATHTVRRANTTGFAAPRFYQVPVTGGTVGPNITQAATFDPNGANVMHRFMPSLAVDRAGNMALGYTTSSSTTKPAIKYAGRLATDPINTFSQTEQVLVQGAGTQTGNCGGAPCTRWGDYSAMSLDPDGCKFWYTNMYYPVDGLDHHTYIGSFNLPQCTTVGNGSVQGAVTSSSGGGPVSGATVALGSRTTTTDASGFYSFSNLPAGTYPSITASFPGYTSSTVNNVVVNESSITTQNFTLSPDANSACLTDTSQADFQKGVATSLDLNSIPGAITLLNAANIDQQNTTLGTQGAGFNNTTWLAQTFTPAVTGQLTRVDVNFFSLSCASVSMPNLTVSIRNASGNLPTGADLAVATIPGFCNGAGGNFTATFASPPTLTAGTQYAIVWRTAAAIPAGTPAPGYFATVSVGTGSVALQNPYAGGRRASSSTSGVTWAGAAGNANNDHGFITYIKTGFSSAGNLVSGLKDANPHAGGAANWTTLSWNAATPAGTAVKFQIAASNSANGPFSFVGPDGTATTFFTTNGESLAQFNGRRYLKYQAFLTTNSGANTPTLNDVTLCFDDTVPTTLAVNSATGTYGGTVNLSATLTDGVSPLSGKTVAFSLNGNSVGSAVTDGSGIASLSNVSLGTINAGTYPTGVGASFAGDTTYLGSNATNSLTVNKADATITVTGYNVTYDGTAHTATGTATGVNAESLTGLELSGTTHTNAGNYAGDAWTFTNINYNDASGTVDDNIARANATINVTPYSVTYDGSAHTATGTVTGVNAESLAGLDLSGTTHTNAGTYTGDAWTFTDATGNYNNASGTVEDTIARANANITVNGYTGVYDGNAHGATGSATGVNGEDLNGLLNLGASFTNVPGGTAHWTFNAGSSNGNYNEASGDVAITITQATPVITWNNPADIVYGTALSGTQLNATASTAGSFAYTPAAGAVLGAGNSQTLHVAFTPTDTNNYTAASKNVSINVLKAVLTITANDKSKTYGGVNPPLTYTPSGFVNGDTAATAFSGSPALSTAATQSSNVGAYQIAAALGTLTSANYGFNFVPGTLTINKAALTVTADNASKLLGAPNPPFTATYSGFVLGQGPSVLGGTLTFTTPATAASPVGSYLVTPGGLTSPNYNITFVNGTLSIGFNICVEFDQSKAKQSGSTVPIKLQLCSASGVNQSSASILVHATYVVRVTTNTPAPVEDAGNANPDDNFRFDGGMYIFNLKTTGYSTGTYLLGFTVAGDPTSHTVQFAIK